MEAAGTTRPIEGEKAARIVDAMRASVARRGAAGSTFEHVARPAALLLRHEGAPARRGRAPRLRPAHGRARRAAGGGDDRRRLPRAPAAHARRADARGPGVHDAPVRAL